MYYQSIEDRDLLFYYIFQQIVFIEVLIKERERSIIKEQNFSNRGLLTETRGQSLLVGPHRPLYLPHRVHLSDPSAHSCQRPQNRWNLFWHLRGSDRVYEAGGRGFFWRHFRTAQGWRIAGANSWDKTLGCVVKTRFLNSLYVSLNLSNMIKSDFNTINIFCSIIWFFHIFKKTPHKSANT